MCVVQQAADRMTKNEFPETHKPKNLRRIFFNETELRAGWRYLIFAVIVIAILGAKDFFTTRTLMGMDEDIRFLLNEGSAVLAFLFAAWIMGRIEKRTVAVYGLPWRQLFLGKFWIGIVMGFSAMSLLLISLHLLGTFNFGTIALHGMEAWKWAGVYGAVFVLVGLKEEFEYRGYGLFTFSSGMGYWPAVILWSLVFAVTHAGNSGENWLGLVNVFAAGIFFALLLQRSGNLWMPIGFHAAWDWAESYFYGVPDSGQVLPGHLFNSGFSGPVWLSGGTVGPEGSIVCTALLATLSILLLIVRPPAASKSL